MRIKALNYEVPEPILCSIKACLKPFTPDDFDRIIFWNSDAERKVRFQATLKDAYGELSSVTVWHDAARVILESSGCDLTELWKQPQGTCGEDVFLNS